MEEKILEIAADIFDINITLLNMEMKIEEIQEWDSLTHIQLVTEVESELNIHIPIDQVGKINKLKDFLKYI